MFHNLTGVANYQGLQYVRTERLTGRKYAVKFEEGSKIFVSPAVHDLIRTDLKAVAEVLTVRILPGRGCETLTGGE